MHLEYLVLALLMAVVPAAFAQEADDEDSPRRPGVVATYTTATGVAATRIDETVAFDWGAAAPEPRLPAEPFSATWRGRLWTQTPGAHRLHVYVQGRVSLKLGGQEVVAGETSEPQWLASEPLELPFDYHPLEIQYHRTGKQGRLGLYWSGPGFVLEPIPARFLFHDRAETPSVALEHGRQLATALRCGACHRDDAHSNPASMPGPALDRLSGNLNRKWLVEWLTAGKTGDSEQEPGDREHESQVQPQPPITRRMPHFELTSAEATAIADWLLRQAPDPAAPSEPNATQDAASKDGSKGQAQKTQPSATHGERLFLTLGCLACHQHGELGESGLFGGGDLTSIAAKRPAAFFERWLADPASLNKRHRMPVFELTNDERKSLALWLAKQETAIRAEEPGTKNQEAREREQEDMGERLVAQLRCASCHDLRGQQPPPAASAKPLAAGSDWAQSCAGDANTANGRPGYRLNQEAQAALRAYYSAFGDQPQAKFAVAPAALGRDLLIHLNCLACHQREGIDRTVNVLPSRLHDKLAAVADLHSNLAKELPAMTPPALNSVGDKLHDTALAAAIRREGPPHRPYLLARMPKFNLTDKQLAALTAHFVATDRIPEGRKQETGDRGQETESPPPLATLAAAGPRLVTTDGFGCTSCHQVGSVKADKAPLNARGPNLSLLDKRIRREWFDRWCSSPARIVPRMEMPSVQVPVRGVLNDNVHDQLAAVWHILNTPGFEPPEPNPVRVLRLSGVPERKEQPIVLHDVVKDGDKTYLFPLVIGLPNRHNILFDLETNRLAAWWLGDTARQRTKGKSWYWELGGQPIFEPLSDDDEVVLIVKGEELRASRIGQFAAQPVTIDAGETSVRLVQSLAFTAADKTASKVHSTVEFSWSAPFSHIPGGQNFHKRHWNFHGLPKDTQVRLRLFRSAIADKAIWKNTEQELVLPEHGIRIRSRYPRPVKYNGDGSITVPIVDRPIAVDYSSDLSADQFQIPAPLPVPLEQKALDIAPGFIAQRLPLADDITPIALAWKPGGRLLFATLKGQVFAADDSKGDGEPDTLSLIADGLPTPYGLSARQDAVDVLAKDGLWRLSTFEIGTGSRSKRRELVAAGWGVSEDYHDWAVGLVPGDKGEHFMALPCQQDKRSEAAATHRGKFLKLVPRKATPDDPSLFDIEVLSSGHRFPMGIAKNRAGDLFVTDNQGNYNPFNELNHVRPGKHFGFINANEKEAGFQAPPVEEPAINIPHPWTRSVNGICFLDTPVGWVKDAQRPMTHADSTLHVPNPSDANGQSTPRGSAPAAGLTHPTPSAFGPLEGHLIGCEYDTRRLIRMTLRKIGDTYQGAAYPLSIPPDDVEKGLLGPIVCAISPRGELYVGEIRDSGWGAGNNVGQIVKIKIEPDKLPCGIAEMRATKTGFTLDFFQPIDAKKAADVANYSLQSYRRESTPAYGGPDLDRRTELVEAAQVSEDRKQVTLTLPELRTGFVYELKLKNLAPNKAMFHPDEAHFTLRQIPQ